MEVWIVYTLKNLLLPPASLLLLALSGLLLSRRRRRAGLLVTTAALVVLVLVSTPLVVRYLAAVQERYPAMDVTRLQAGKAQVIVVLGGGMHSNAREYHGATVNGRTLERLHYAARLARQTGLPLLVSGGNVFSARQPSEAELMAESLHNDFRIDARWLETRSRNTAENARFSHSMLARSGVSRIILVTHAMHMARALEQFELAGFEVLPAPTVFRGATSPVNLLSFIPSAQALEISAMAMHEQLGKWWYFFRYHQY